MVTDRRLTEDIELKKSHKTWEEHLTGMVETFNGEVNRTY